MRRGIRATLNVCLPILSRSHINFFALIYPVKVRFLFGDYYTPRAMTVNPFYIPFVSLRFLTRLSNYYTPHMVRYYPAKASD